MVQGFQKVRAGQQYAGFPAHVYNSIVDVINAYKRGQLTNLGVAGDTVRSSGVVHVQNNSGAARARLEVLGIDEALILPTADLLEFKDRARVACITPTADHVPDLFVVLREPIASGKVGLATISGVCPALVNVGDEAHGWAGCEASTYANLVSRVFGGARILWKEAGTGVKRAIVRIGTAPEIGIVEITGTACEETDRDAGTCLWSGTLQTLDTADTCSPWSDGESIWVLQLNVCDAEGDDAIIKIRGGEKFVGARLGLYDNGGDERELYAIRNTDIGKVRVNVEDDLDFLEDQYEDHVATGTYVDGDLLVKSQTDDVAGDQQIRRFVDSSGYNSNEQILTHPNGADTPTWSDAETVTVITDLRIYGTEIQKRTSTLKAIDVQDQGWSTALPATECP